MIPINVSALSNSVYIRQEQERGSGSRVIHRFILQDSNSQQIIDSAVTTINSLIRDNPTLCFVSRSGEQETLQQKVSRFPYLIINGHALCLSNKTKAPNDIDISCKDVFFSEAIIEEPVQCSRQHTFEKKYVEVWVREKGNICPYFSNHEVGPIEVDDYVLERIRSITLAHQNQAQINRESIEERRIQNARITTLQSYLGASRAEEITGGVAKVTAKGVGFFAINYGKKVPIISVIFGSILCGYRIYKGYQEGNNAEYIKAFGEIASFAAACFPGYGTAASISIDIAMAGHDVYEVYNGKIEVNVVTAHRTLGLDPNQAHSKEAVDRAFRDMTILTHPDRIRRFGEYNQQELNDLQATVINCKNVLYQHYGFNN